MLEFIFQCFLVFVGFVYIFSAVLFLVLLIVHFVSRYFKMQKRKKKREELGRIIEEIERLPAGKEKEIRMRWTRAQALESFVESLKIAIRG